MPCFPIASPALSRVVNAVVSVTTVISLVHQVDGIVSGQALERVQVHLQIVRFVIDKKWQTMRKETNVRTGSALLDFLAATDKRRFAFFNCDTRHPPERLTAPTAGFERTSKRTPKELKTVWFSSARVRLIPQQNQAYLRRNRGGKRPSPTTGSTPSGRRVPRGCRCWQGKRVQ